MITRLRYIEWYYHDQWRYFVTALPYIFLWQGDFIVKVTFTVVSIIYRCFRDLLCKIKCTFGNWLVQNGSICKKKNVDASLSFIIIFWTIFFTCDRRYEIRLPRNSIHNRTIEKHCVYACILSLKPALNIFTNKYRCVHLIKHWKYVTVLSKNAIQDSL